ncbi:Ig-like domain-containing protein [Candidatus Rhodobacter oscarellae]|uniref:Ig-like domain-containing protein n=1 Tax=Candidatus Rhodobacter oscarellae TaxID=1675527 RepID=UPI0006707BE9|nr:Ig-like domain-containing protein [Candidatus Rhodobacter lobularis]
MRFSIPLRLLRALCASVFLTGGIGTAALGDQGSITFPTVPTDPVVLQGAETTDAFEVFVGAAGDCCDGRRPITGRYQSGPSGLAFTPSFGFEPGQPYVLRHAKTGHLTEFALASAVKPPQVTAVAPTGDTLPENTLRFYIHFSQPMKPHVAQDYIRLEDAQGNIDDAAFMQFKQELWSPDRTRLTLLMDPGRIKRGVAQNVTLGPALEEGKSYKLVVEGGWPTASGSGETDRFEKAFAVTAPLRTLPDVANWAVSAPRSSTTDPIVVNFDRPFDSIQLQAAIQVHSGSSLARAGTSHVNNSGQTWTFVPSGNWATDITLSINPTLEDVAGNNFRELLDHAVGTDGLEIDRISVPVALLPSVEVTD